MIFKNLRIYILLALGMASPLYAQNDHFPQFMEMGNKALNNGNYDLALEYYQSAIDDNSDCWQAYVGMGNCYYYEKKLKESLKAYLQAQKINPDNDELGRFILFLRSKMGAAAPKPTPTPLPGLALPPPDNVLPPSK